MEQIDDRWRVILRTPLRTDGHWVDLPTIDRSVLVAFIAGPGRARGVRILAGTSMPVENPPLSSSSPRAERSVITLEDLEDALSDTRAYLRDLRLPAPPEFMRWSVLVPHDVSARQFTEEIDKAASPAEVLDDPVMDATRCAHAVARVVALLLRVPNPLHHEL